MGVARIIDLTFVSAGGTISWAGTQPRSIEDL
jgi:hypothetical protein